MREPSPATWRGLRCKIAKTGDLTDAHGFAEQCRLRWMMVETAYKDYEPFRPCTTSKNESVRMLLLFFPLFTYNAWVLALHILQMSGSGVPMTLKKTFRLFIRFTRNFVLARFLIWLVFSEAFVRKRVSHKATQAFNN